jgi:hypothetical protein
MFNCRNRIGVDDNAVMSATDTLAAQLGEIFGGRLKMVAAFGVHSHTCAIVDAITTADLDKCAALSAGWKKRGLAPPLLIPVDELSRALDAFPLEFSEIIASRQLIAGADLLASLAVPAEDLRRACEMQARGHLVHLRQAYIEAAGDRKAVARLVSASVIPFGALLSNVARLDGAPVDELRARLGITERDFPDVLRAAERLVSYVDRWDSRK